MDKKNSVEYAILKVTNYTKNLKEQVQRNQYQASIGSPQPWTQNYASNSASFFEPYSSSIPFTKTKSKADSAVFIKADSPVHSRTSNASREKSSMNMSMKIGLNKKDKLLEIDRESALNKSQGRYQIKHLSNLLPGSVGTKQIYTKKNGHAHTYTLLNQPESDNFSQIDSNYSAKPSKINRMRHSKSPSKERHIEHNNTSYGQQSYKVVHHMNKIHIRQKVNEQKKGVSIESKYLLEQILHLEEVIKQYKMLIVELKDKYLHVEQKLREKVLNDHYIDVLKEQIQEMQEKNHQLYVTIEQQREIIDKGEKKFIQKLQILNQHYAKSEQENVQLKKQNQALRQILYIACQPCDQNQQKEDQIVLKEFKIGNDTKDDPYYQTVARSSQQFWAKWT